MEKEEKKRLERMSVRWAFDSVTVIARQDSKILISDLSEILFTNTGGDFL